MITVKVSLLRTYSGENISRIDEIHYILMYASYSLLKVYSVCKHLSRFCKQYDVHDRND